MLKDKILGGLYGQALGDAWGMPAYFDPDQTWQAYGGWITDFCPARRITRSITGCPRGASPTTPEQAFSLARAFIEHGGVTLEASVEAIIAWYDRVGGDTSPYVGPSTRRGVQALKRGEDPRTTGTWGDTNGAPMRISPVGLLHPGDPLGAIADAEIACVPTHNTNVAISGACAVAAAIAVAVVEGATLDSVIAAGIMGAELGRSKGRPWLGPVRVAPDSDGGGHRARFRRRHRAPAPDLRRDRHLALRAGDGRRGVRRAGDGGWRSPADRDLRGQPVRRRGHGGRDCLRDGGRVQGHGRD
ncbi:MAG: ADP-ribosylglycohydrolase family protein [Anaerolineae bacterium]|nr:ADP-ribosylglycohydrolase family protein [Anaerolineae bacterium]